MSKRFTPDLIGACVSDWVPSYYKGSTSEGSPIYTPKRHKFKRRNKKCK